LPGITRIEFAFLVPQDRLLGLVLELPLQARKVSPSG
jgi:hypothetical protein